MADIDNQGRDPKSIPAPKEDKNAIHTKATKEKPTEPELKDVKNMFKLDPTQHVQGNELIVLVQVLTMINKNIAFFASTFYTVSTAVCKRFGIEVKDGRSGK